MAKTEYIFLQGKAKWARLINPDMKYEKWSVVLYPDGPSLEKIRELQSEGVKNVIRKDEDGYYCTFSRPIARKNQGKLVSLSPPEVIDKNNNLLRDALVGNGSDVTLKIEVYQHGTPGGGKAKAARLLSVRVDTLVPYTVSKDFDPEQKKAIEGLDKQPEQLF